MMSRISKYRRAGLAACAAFSAALLGGCYTVPPPHPVYDAPPPPQQPVVQVYAYPLRGQTAEQQDRDHYECSMWSTQQTGFDPSAPGIPPHQRVQVVSAGPPPGTNTAIGAVTGAIIGAAIGGPYNGGPAALAGAVVGGAIGSSADAANAQATRTVVVTDQRAAAAAELRAANYRRAIGACLDARGYSVR
jgi:hypothetical protein